MAITFLEKRKRQKYLILVFVVVILITFFVIWKGFFQKPAGRSAEFVPPAQESLPPQKAEINWQVLKDPRLQVLEPFEEISPTEEEIGRENPFVPYE